MMPMKLLMSSQGFTTQEIVSAAEDLLKKKLESTNVAVINEAYIGIPAGKDQRWLINELANVERYVKGNISFVNLRARPINEIEQELEHSDLIYIVGGAQRVLPQLFRTIGFDLVVKKLAEEKVIMGSSAGASVLGRHIENAVYWENQYGESERYLSAETLGFVDFNILPHFARDDHPKRNTETIAPILKDNPFLLYGITDSQAIVYDNGEIRFIGGAVEVFGRVPGNI